MAKFRDVQELARYISTVDGKTGKSYRNLEIAWKICNNGINSVKGSSHLAKTLQTEAKNPQSMIAKVEQARALIKKASGY